MAKTSTAHENSLNLKKLSILTGVVLGLFALAGAGMKAATYVFFTKADADPLIRQLALVGERMAAIGVMVDENRKGLLLSRENDVRLIEQIIALEKRVSEREAIAAKYVPMLLQVEANQKTVIANLERVTESVRVLGREVSELRGRRTKAPPEEGGKLLPPPDAPAGPVTKRARGDP